MGVIQHVLYKNAQGTAILMMTVMESYFVFREILLTQLFLVVLGLRMEDGIIALMS